ncbi:MAG: response regulator [Pseudonocardiaceae bacterium]|nr:response regulator [Pseudonocardiaceae bacterium]
MSGTLMRCWESDGSQFDIRRRACLAATSEMRDRLAALVVDQDTDVIRELIDALAGQPVEMRGCTDPAEALLVVGRTCPDVVVLGPTHGRLAAAEFLSIVRGDDESLPIIVGVDTDSGDFASQATALGATVVIPRPYRPHELLRLLRSFAPRPERLELRPLPIDLGRLRIDGAVPQCWLDGDLIALPPMEFLLLRYLAERAGAVLTRSELLGALWQDRPQASSNTLTVHIMRLRKRLGDDENDPQWIRSIRGLGYQFTVPDPAHGSPDAPTV